MRTDAQLVVWLFHQCRCCNPVCCTQYIIGCGFPSHLVLTCKLWKVEMLYLEDCSSVMSFLTHLNAETPFRYSTNTKSRGSDSLKNFFLWKGWELN